MKALTENQKQEFLNDLRELINIKKIKPIDLTSDAPYFEWIWYCVQVDKTITDKVGDAINEYYYSNESMIHDLLEQYYYSNRVA